MKGMDREQGNSHLEWVGQLPPFLVVPEKKLVDPLHFKTLMPIMTRGKTKYGELHVCVCPVAKSCLTLCNPVDCNPPGASVHETLQTRILEWVVISSSRGSSRPRDQTCISCGFFTTWATWEAWGNIQRVPIWQSRVWSRASDDLVEITGKFFYLNIGCCKQIGEGGPWRKRIKHDFILVQDILWSKPGHNACP